MRLYLSVTAAFLLTVAQPALAAKTEYDAMLKGLPPAKAQLIIQAVDAVADAQDARYQQLESIRREMFAILEAEKFDATAYMAKARDYEGLRADLVLKRKEAMARAATQLTVAERQAMLKAVFKQDKELARRDRCEAAP